MYRYFAISILLIVPVLARLTPEQREKLPPPADQRVDFNREIRPILEASCIKCHGRGKAKGGFAIDTRETLLKGGESGAAVVPGKSTESLLIEMVSGLDPDNVMPQKGSKLSGSQVGLLRAWIDQDLPWEENVTFGKLPPINLHPRQPDVPPGVDKNPIDRFIAAYNEKLKLEPGDPVSDRVFARRAYLDAIGLLPTPEELENFFQDTRSNKRHLLVEELLSRRMDYATHWLSFWNDALRNDYKGTGFIDSGRKQITSWLFSALYHNKPFNAFVSELINPDKESEGFSKGIVWRGVVNASQTPEMQAAQNISQVFMGVNLKCASCHDSFINDWMLSDAYGLASIYADGPLEMFKCDAPTGQKATMKFIYPELGELSASAAREDRLKQLAEIVTSERNGRLTRTIVNRLWSRLLGRGLIEPVDDLDHPAWNQDLLDWLASDLVAHKYDLKQTIALIMRSRAYQLPAAPAAETASTNFVFRGPAVRRLSAEQFIDAVARLTARTNRAAAARIDFASITGNGIKPNFSDAPAHPSWIWNHERAATRSDPNTIYFRKFVEIPQIPTAADFIVTCDNSFKLYLNGTEIGSGSDFGKPKTINVTTNLRAGINLIAVQARNTLAAPDKPDAEQTSPAGFWFYGRVRAGTNQMDFASDSTWLWTVDAGEGWNKAEFPAANWTRASEVGDSAAEPWKLGKTLAEATANVEFYATARAALANNDALMTALGRPNREQVVTSRPSTATTLQGLELTNGPTLAEELRGASAAIAQQNVEVDHLITKLYLTALGRSPSEAEQKLSKELLGARVSAEGVQDFLWAMLMLPEFQLIY